MIKKKSSGRVARSPLMLRFTYVLIFGLALTALSLSIWASLLERNFTSLASTSNNLTVSTSTFLGGSIDDDLESVAIAPDKTVVIGGSVPVSNFGKTPQNLTTIGSSTPNDGVIVRMTPDGRNILTLSRIGGKVNDLGVMNDGRIVAVGDFGVAVLDNTASQVVWSKVVSNFGGATASDGIRVSVAQDNKIAVLANKNINVYAADGTSIGQFNVTGTYVEDIAIDSISQTVLVTGYNQKDGGDCAQLQVAYIKGFEYSGAQKWSGYDWSHEQAAGADNSCADTRGIRVSIGEDGKAYFAGETAGGNTIYRYDPRDLNRNALNVKFDAFNDPYNTTSNHITYYSRINPGTGDLEKGQFALARLTSGAGNTIRPRDITADAQGNLILVGSSAASFADRDSQTINGNPIGAYNGGDNFVLSVSPNFESRNYMTTFTNGCNATMLSVATRNGQIATVGNSLSSGCNMVLVNPLINNAQGGNDGFVAVWGNVSQDVPISSSSAPVNSSSSSVASSSSAIASSSSGSNPASSASSVNSSSTSSGPASSSSNSNPVVSSSSSPASSSSAPVNSSSSSVASSSSAIASSTSSSSVQATAQLNDLKKTSNGRLDATTTISHRSIRPNQAMSISVKNIRLNSGVLAKNLICKFRFTTADAKKLIIQKNSSTDGECQLQINENRRLASLLGEVQSLAAPTVTQGSLSDLNAALGTVTVSIEATNSFGYSAVTNDQTYKVGNTTEVNLARTGGDTLILSAVGLSLLTIVGMLLILSRRSKIANQIKLR